jgi:hypothetical protein
MQEILDFVTKTGLQVKTYWIPPYDDKQDLILHLDVDDATAIIEQLRRMGYSVDIREFSV